jgi:hypothetical protein
MEHYRYPARSLVSDYLRVALGLAATVGPLLALDLARGVAIGLSGLGVLFGWFGVRTVLRQLSWIELSAAEVALCGPIRRRVAWRQLRGLELAYYAPRRGRRDGWLQLTLRGQSGPAIRVDSTLEEFEEVLRVAAGSARRNQLTLGSTTEANLAALGLSAGAAPPLRPERSDLQASGRPPAKASP